MKIVLIAVGLLAAGVVGGVTADLLRTETPVTPSTVDTGRLEARMAGLETLIARQSDEIRTLRDAAVLPAAPAALAGGPDALAPFAEAAEAAATPAELEEKVEKIIEEKERKDREARTERWAAMMAEREAARLKRLQTELGLTDYQTDELGTILAERRKVFMELRSTMFTDGGAVKMTPEQRTAMREKGEKAQADAEDKVKSLLSTDQYEAYQKQASNSGWGGGRGGGGRGRGR